VVAVVDVGEKKLAGRAGGDAWCFSRFESAVAGGESSYGRLLECVRADVMMGGQRWKVGYGLCKYFSCGFGVADGGDDGGSRVMTMPEQETRVLS
jgi:hypothetical protein